MGRLAFSYVQINYIGLVCVHVCTDHYMGITLYHNYFNGILTMNFPFPNLLTQPNLSTPIAISSLLYSENIAHLIEKSAKNIVMKTINQYL